MWKLFGSTKHGFPVFLLVNRICRVLLSAANSPLLGSTNMACLALGLFAALNKTRQIAHWSNRNTGNLCFVDQTNPRVIIGTIPLPSCWLLGCKTLGQALGFCLSQQNTWARGLFLKHNTCKLCQTQKTFQSRVYYWLRGFTRFIH